MEFDTIYCIATWSSQTISFISVDIVLNRYYTVDAVCLIWRDRDVILPCWRYPMSQHYNVVNLRICSRIVFCRRTRQSNCWVFCILTRASFAWSIPPAWRPACCLRSVQRGHVTSCIKSRWIPRFLLFSFVLFVRFESKRFEWLIALTFWSFIPPYLHLTTSKVVVIVSIIRTVLYIANLLPVQWAQLTKQFIQPGWALSLYFCVSFEWFIFMFVLPWTVESFPFMFGAGVTNLNEPPSSFLLPPHYCGLGAGSVPSRAIVNKKQCETRRLFMSLVIRYWIGDVQDSQCVSISQIANYKYF